MSWPWNFQHPKLHRSDQLLQGLFFTSQIAHLPTPLDVHANRLRPSQKIFTVQTNSGNLNKVGLGVGSIPFWWVCNRGGRWDNSGLNWVIRHGATAKTEKKQEAEEEKTEKGEMGKKKSASNCWLWYHVNGENSLGMIFMFIEYFLTYKDSYL